MSHVAQPPPANTAALLRTLKEWSARGSLRRLDSAFAGFMLDLCPEAPPPVVMAAALVAHMEGRGHSCLSIEGLLRDPDSLLGWDPEASAEFHAVATVFAFRLEEWLAALRDSPLVWIDESPSRPSQTDANRPLVLRGARLYLRRYWRYERQVATRVLERAAAMVMMDEQGARRRLEQLFPPAAMGSQRNAGPPQVPLTPSGGLTRKRQVWGRSEADARAEPSAPLDWQKIACAMALRSGLSVITGGPGTGKTYTAARLLALLLALDPHPERLRVAVAAPTGKAAARLKQSIDGALEALQAEVNDPSIESLVRGIGPARTLHSLLGARPDTRRFRFDAANPLEVDVLIVDEASMIHLEMMAALLEALPAQSRLILLGDKDQLASVEAGAVLGDLCRDADLGRYRPETAAYVRSVSGERIPADFLSDGPPLAQQTVMLRTSRRFGDRIGQLAQAANAGDFERAGALLDGAGSGAGDGRLAWLDATSAEVAVRLAVQGRPGAPGGYGGKGGYLELLQQRPALRGDLLDDQAFDDWAVRVLQAFERFRLLCAVHEGEWGTKQLNSAIERALAAKGLLSRRGEWYEGRPVMVTRNDAGLGVSNGDIGIVLRPMTLPGATSAPARVYFLEGASTRSVGVSRLAHVETAFALTVHKSQGSEFEHTALVLPQTPSRVLTRELIYTGITRARAAFTLVTGRRQAFADALGQRTQRSSGLLELLQCHSDGPPRIAAR